MPLHRTRTVSPDASPRHRYGPYALYGSGFANGECFLSATDMLCSHLQLAAGGLSLLKEGLMGLLAVPLQTLPRRGRARGRPSAPAAKPVTPASSTRPKRGAAAADATPPPPAKRGTAAAAEPMTEPSMLQRALSGDGAAARALGEGCGAEVALQSQVTTLKAQLQETKELHMQKEAKLELANYRIQELQKELGQKESELASATVDKQAMGKIEGELAGKNAQVVALEQQLNFLQGFVTNKLSAPPPQPLPPPAWPQWPPPQWPPLQSQPLQSSQPSQPPQPPLQPQPAASSPPSVPAMQQQMMQMQQMMQSMQQSMQQG